MKRYISLFGLLAFAGGFLLVYESSFAQPIPPNNIEGECYAEDTSILLGESTTWIADIENDDDFNFDYEWSGTDELEGRRRTVEKQYITSGVKRASVVVSYDEDNDGDPDDEAIIECRNVVTVRPAELAGACTVKVDQEEDGVEITWSVEPTGGILEYEYRWFGTDGLEGTEETTTKLYNTAGTKLARVEVTSGNQQMTLECRAEIDELDESSVGGSCDIDRIFVDEDDHDDPEDAMVYEWQARSINADTSNNNEVRYRWTGNDGLEGEDRDVEIEYDTEGIKSGKVQIQADNGSVVVGCQVKAVPQSEVPNGRGSGCFIATAAFGTELEPEVEALRDFRDNYLLTNKVGEKFVEAYYEVSPPLADYIRDKEAIKFGVRQALKPLVVTAKILN